MIKFVLRMFGWLSSTIFMLSAVHADVPTQRLQALSRGINLYTSIFEEPEATAQWLTDLISIRSAGFYHVRIFVNADDLEDEHLPEAEWRWTRLDTVVKAAVHDHLAVILCMFSRRHPFDNTANADTIEHWRFAWRRLAQVYRQTSQNQMFFEIANEPTADGARWSAIQEQLRAEIRQLAPANTLLLTPSPLAMVWSMPTLTISRDTNVIYIFHLYQPMVFTHQGAGWANPAYKEITSLDYPPNAANIQAIMARPPVAADAAAIKELTQYEHIGGTMIGTEIAKAKEWAQQHRVHVMSTEFGADVKASPSSRAAWLCAARRQFEAAGFGWTVFQYEGSFGLKGDLLQILGPCR